MSGLSLENVASFVSQFSFLQGCSLPFVAFIFFILFWGLCLIPVRFIRLIGAFLALTSFGISIFGYEYLNNYIDWESEPAPYEWELVRQIKLSAISGDSSLTGAYVLDIDDAYIVMIKLRQIRLVTYNPTSLSKMDARLLYDDNVKHPCLKVYQSCRNYECPHPGLLWLLTFGQHSSFLPRHDPEGSFRYEIVLPDASMLTSLSSTS